jgi:hypothetical protein
MDQIEEPVGSSHVQTKTDSAVDENTSLLPKNIQQRENQVPHLSSVVSNGLQDARIEEGGQEAKPEHSLRHVFGIVSVMLIGES